MPGGWGAGGLGATAVQATLWQTRPNVLTQTFVGRFRSSVVTLDFDAFVPALEGCGSPYRPHHLGPAFFTVLGFSITGACERLSLYCSDCYSARAHLPRARFRRPV